MTEYLPDLLCFFLSDSTPKIINYVQQIGYFSISNFENKNKRANSPESRNILIRSIQMNQNIANLYPYTN